MKALFVTDRTLIDSLRTILDKEHVQVETVEQTTEIESRVLTGGHQLVLLDRDRLGGLGTSRLLRWRRDGVTAHILMLLPRDCTGADKVAALDAGADSYLIKPIDAEELRARIRALSRVDGNSDGHVIRAHDLELDPIARRARRSGRPIHLTEREFDLLQLLVHNQGRVLTRSRIREHLYDGLAGNFSNVVDVYIRYLREKIDKNCDTPLILTCWGQGYLFRAENA